MSSNTIVTLWKERLERRLRETHALFLSLFPGRVEDRVESESLSLPCHTFAAVAGRSGKKERDSGGGQGEVSNPESGSLKRD